MRAKSTTPLTVRVTTSPRLHITLIDLEGATSGRVDGGAGLSIRDPEISILASRRLDDKINVHADVQNHEVVIRIQQALECMQKLYSLGGASIEVERTTQLHVGLGTATQTLLASATAYCRLNDVVIHPREIAMAIGRGGTSGVGVATFEAGGFVVDCGHRFSLKGGSFAPSSGSAGIAPPPLLGRYLLADWPVLVVTPAGRTIAAGDERALFAQRCPIPLEDVRACAHTILSMLIPAALEADLETFCRAITLIQDLAWKRYEIAQQARVVRDLMDLLRCNGVEGVGMSSWGPTLFGLGSRLSNPAFCHSIAALVREFLSERGGGGCWLTTTLNEGARVQAKYGKVRSVR